MKKYKYLIGSVLLIIFVGLILMPRSPERVYVIYDSSLNDCSPKILKENFIKGYYIICDESKFINFTENKEKKSITKNLNKIKNYTITPKEEILQRFSSFFFLRIKNDFDLLNRYKKFDFNLIIKDTILNRIKIVPVKYTEIVGSDNLEDELIKNNN